MATDVEVNVKLDVSGLRNAKIWAAQGTVHALDQGAQVMLEAIRGNAPNYGDTYPQYEGPAKTGRRPIAGLLAESLKVLAESNGERDIGTTLFYAHWVEYGVAPHAINARRADFMTWPDQVGGPTKHVDHPGFTETGFFRLGIAESRAAVSQVMADAYKAALTGGDMG